VGRKKRGFGIDITVIKDRIYRYCRCERHKGAESRIGCFPATRVIKIYEQSVKATVNQMSFFLNIRPWKREILAPDPGKSVVCTFLNHSAQENPEQNGRFKAKAEQQL